MEEEPYIAFDPAEVSQNNVNIYLDETIDKEIICNADADISYEPSSSWRQNNQKKKVEEKKAKEESITAKASKLWMRRSRQKSLELKVPQKIADSNTEEKGDIAVEENESNLEELHSSDKSPVAKRKQEKKAAKAKKHEREGEQRASSDTLRVPSAGEEESKPRANSESSNTSDAVLLGRASMPAALPNRVHATHSNHLPNYQSTTDSGQSHQTSTPKTSSNRRAFSLANTVGAMNALRKMMGRKDSETEHSSHAADGNSEADGNEDDNTARRRWRMIFNVSKFENIVRSPQVPERVDESLFYTTNIKHHGHKGRLVSTGGFFFPVI